MNIKPKVLIIDDHPNLAKMYKDLYGDKAEFSAIFSIKGIQEMLEKNDSLDGIYDVIVMDACLTPMSDEPTAKPFVSLIKKKFCGPLIASSSIRQYRLEFMELGCTHECDKNDLLKKILGLLKNDCL